MSGMEDLLEFLRMQMAMDEQWARAASQAYPHATDKTVPETGVHWTWVAGENWEPVTPDPVVDEFVAEPGHSCNLATVEQWPTAGWGGDDAGIPMPQTYASSIAEMDASAAGHIVRWVPARVLTLITAMRQVVEDYSWEARETAIIQALAEALYSGHPDWRAEWAPRHVPTNKVIDYP
jgi:hypothetical protein